MSKLEAALAWARRGFRVFRLQENGKLPYDAMSWTLDATTDEAIIRMWWVDPVTGSERDNNIGFLTTDWIVPDVDVKHNKPGIATMLRLGLEFDTLTMRTPTGGYHLVYQGLSTPVGGSPLGLGVDLKSHNGYVVAPGSTIDGAPYVVELDLPVAPFPEHLRPALRPPRAQAGVVPAGVELDTPEIVELVAHWLLHDAPVAVEGQNGDDTTYRVACRMRDFGVSEGAALDLFMDEYNPRCEPPWEVGAARAKIENAYRYASGEQGSAAPAAVFDNVVPVSTAKNGTMAGAPVDPGIFRFGNMMDEEDIRPRPWVLEGFLMERNLTMLVATGGVGKSVLSLMVAAHLAVGRDFMGFATRKPGRSIIYNAEDDLEEVSRRLISVCDAYGFDRHEVSSRICLLGSDDLPLQVTENQPPRVKHDHVRMLIEAASDPDVVMLSLDPIVEVHSGRENDSGDMRYVMGVLRTIARQANVAGLAIQHTGKPPTGQATQAGDQNAGRGSSAMPAAARVVLTMYPATEKECLDIGVPLAERSSYVRLDGAKATHQEAAARRTRWLKWESRKIASGDSVGVLVEHDAATVQASEGQRVALLLQARMLRDGSAVLPVEEAINTVLEGADPMAPREERDVVKNRLTRLLSGGVCLGETCVTLTTDASGGRKSTMVVLR